VEGLGAGGVDIGVQDDPPGSLAGQVGDLGLPGKGLEFVPAVLGTDRIKITDVIGIGLIATARAKGGDSPRTAPMPLLPSRLAYPL
jgi:hypothetical protein